MWSSRPIIAVVMLIMLGTFGGRAFGMENELGWTLDSALKQLGRQGDDFETLLADVQIHTRTAAGAAVREASGRFYMNRNGEIRIRGDQGKEVLVSRSEVQEYTPTEALVDLYSLSKHKDRMEPYATLGFTETGKDLNDDFLVTMLGEDAIRGERVLVLELTPKKDKVRQVVSKVTLWINESSWMPMRQVIEHVSTNEVLTVDYQGAARNLQLNPQLFKADWPRGTKKVRR